MTFDVIVLGVGGMGSSACYHLARRGARVLGIEQHTLGHSLGSSHGETRLIRRAYFEEEKYVPLVTRAYTLWDALSAESGRQLLHRTGLLIFGPAEGGTTLPRLMESARKHDIAVEAIAREDLLHHYPQFHPPEGYHAVYEAGAGYLDVEPCVIAHAELARRAGAVIRENERVERWSASPSEVEVVTSTDVVRAAKLVVTAGPWSGRVLETLRLPLAVLRVPLFWFAAPDSYESERGCPAWAFDRPDGFIYGFPRLHGLVKAADYHPSIHVVEDPAEVDRSIQPVDSEKIVRLLAECLPAVAREPARAAVCMYTMTPDANFIVDLHPDHDNVAFAAGFSGHGFKFASVIGECLADLATQGDTDLPIGFLRRRHALG